MRRPVRTLSFAALLGAASFVPSLRLANAGPATDDNDELVADPEFTGLPDKDSHSGVFLDIIAAGSSSIVQDSYYRVVTEPATASLKVLVFDGNCGGLWDQNLIQHGAGSAVLPDGSVVEYDLMTDSPDFPRTVVALGESESATPRPGAKVFSYAVDSRWEFLYDGPNHPSSTVLATGEHQYVLHVKYRLPTPSGAAVAPINGFKLAANGVLGQSPNAGETLLGGFIGGVVDSRNLLFALPGAPAAGSEYSVSRDHYPDALEPAASLNGLLLNGAAYAPAVRYPAPDAYENRYAGSFDIRVRLVPKPGESWAQFLASLILEEGDADDVDDASGVGPDGMPSPSIAGVPPDDGRFYVDTSGRQHDNSGYRLPVAAAPADAGSPWLELIDPNGVVRVTLFDLSGNVSQEDATGNAFERIPVPADGVPGLWTLRMHHLDARNSWFLRTNAETRADRQSLEGRVFCDLDGDTTDDLDTDPGIAGVVVTIQRTDVAGVPPILRTTDATGAWRVETIAAGTYAVSVTDGQAPIGAKKKTTTQPVPATVAPSQNVRDVDLGYLPSGAVGDRVWCDEDGDKAQDPGEPGLDGVTVELYRLDPQGPVLLGTRATAGGGVYLFDNLPDAIYRAVVRTDTVPGKKTPTTETTCDATITGGGSELGCDFGFRPVGALGDRVWEDRDGDGTQGPPATEPGLNGVVVELLDATGTVVLRTTTTTGDGGYLFEGLADGEYRVRVAEASVPPGYARTTPATNPRAASVVDGSVDLTVDFGYRATGRLGDRVWCDEDGDQVQDPEEPGLVGVTVELYRVVAGVPTFLATQTTGTNGAYLFDALPDGTYRAVVLPATVPGAKEPTTETTCEEAIVAGSSALGCDFGFRPAGALGDRVWHDCDRDGVQDADEPGFDGVVVRLYLVTPQAPVLVRTTTTANDGHYLFDHLDDGAYLVEVDESALRPTMFRSWPALNPLPSAVVDGSKDLTRDFGYCFLGAIGDRVWLDRDGDGLQDLPADEPGIDGAVVRLYEVTPAGPVLVGTKTTAGGGLYLFDNLPDATYRVEVDESGLPGLARTAPAANPTTAVIAGGERRFDVDFGYRPRGAIGDRVWLDVDGDAVQDAPADEPGLDGVTVLLLRRQGDVLSIVATKTTAGGGLYRFDGLDDGEYLVTVDDTTLPKAVVRTFPATVPATATITNGSEDLTKDFGYRYTGRIGDRVWLDVDGDTVQDAPADEPGLDGVTVTLARVVAGVPVPVGTRTTANGGAYLFDGLPDGEYRVDVVPASLPAGLTRTFPATVPATATITNGSEDLTKDFGYQPPPPPPPTGRIGDRVWLDVDGDTVQDAPADEPGLDGVTVTLARVVAGVPVPVGTRTTANGGAYLFDGLPDGEYRVDVVPASVPAGLTRTFPATVPATTTITNGSEDLTKDFGFQPPPPPPPTGRIGDRVWLDVDGDAVQDAPADEPGLDGVTVTLARVVSGVPVPVGTRTTANGGAYLFDGLPDGEYRVDVVPASVPAGLTRTFPATVPATATITNGSEDLTKDFGFQPPPPPPPTGRIGDRVWLDVDGDTVQDAPADEPGLDGVTVTLARVVAGVPVPVGTRTTANGGAYLFDGLPDGEYRVDVVPASLPAGLVRTFPATVPATATITNGSEDLTKDFGYRPSDECDPGDDPRLSKLCLEASVWLADPTTTTFDVYVRLDRGEQPGRLVDLACVGFDGPLPGPVAGRNGVLTITGFRVEDGYAKVTVCLDAHTAAFPGGSFAGTHRLEVVVNGVGEAAADRLEAPPLVRGGTFPHDWAPLWCDDLPDFRVVSWTWFACDPDKPCTDGCVKPRTWWVTVSSHGACDATRVPWPMPRAEDRRLCGATWLQILERAPTRATAWTLLAQAWIVAQLNAADGACVSPAVAAAIEEAGALLGQTCDCLCGCATGRAGELTQLLDAFNSGGAGPKPCTEPLPCCPKPPKPSKPSAPKSVARGR